MRSEVAGAAQALDGRLVPALGLSCVAAALAMLLGAMAALAASVSLILTLAAALGATRQGRLGPFRPFLGAALLTWLLAFGLMLGLPADAGQLILGLPPATAASVFVLWLGPLFLVTLPYALYFDCYVLTAEDLAEIESLIRRQAE